MRLRPNLTNRRQFLGRSALGAGSLLLAPLLLDSCTDHIIPDPNPHPPLFPPLLGDFQVDWDAALKTVTLAGLAEVPLVGGFLGPLADILWPGESQPNVWDQIKDKVEALIKQEIDASFYQQVSDKLSGLEQRVKFYRQALAENVSATNTSEWLNTRDAFGDAQTLFQDQTNSLLLLPLFAQYATLYLSVLRDTVIWAKFASFHGYNSPIQFDRNEAATQDDIKNLQDAIRDLTAHAYKVYNDGLKTLPANYDFNTINPYNNQMVLTVFDYVDTWQYYDYTTYPFGAVDSNGNPINTMPREIYSNYYGENPGLVYPPWVLSPPTQLPSRITVWGYDRIDAVQVTYPDGGGPNGGNQTDRMGDKNGGQIDQHGGDFYTNTPNSPGIITQVRIRSAQFVPQRNDIPCVYTLQFIYNNGAITNLCGGANYTADQDRIPNDLVNFPNHALSSVYIPGVSSYYGINSANCILFGFKYWQAPAVTLNAIRVLYVKSPQEKSIADYAKAFPKLGITAALIDDELKETRKKYWAYIAAWVKTHK